MKIDWYYMSVIIAAMTLAIMAAYMVIIEKAYAFSLMEYACGFVIGYNLDNAFYRRP